MRITALAGGVGGAVERLLGAVQCGLGGLRERILENAPDALRDALEARGVFGAVFCAPATSRNRAMVRLTLNAALTDAEMSHVETVTAELAPTVRPWDWPIARRSPVTVLA